MVRRRANDVVLIIVLCFGMWFIFVSFNEVTVKRRGTSCEETAVKPGRRETTSVKRRSFITVNVTEICRLAPQLPGIPDKMFFHHLVANQPLNLVYCFVPKAGCTFWKRAFYFIQKAQENVPIKSLFDIQKNEIHTLHMSKLKHVGPDFARRHGFLNAAKKIIIVREPYSRLYSAWVDKLYLPDFWEGIGVHIVKNYRRNANQRALQCGHDVTFREFLLYVVGVASATTFTEELFDDHWLPISRLCQTCNIHYDLVGQVEEFSQTRDEILLATGMSKYIPTNISSTQTDIDTIRLNIAAYRGVPSTKPYCTEHKDILRRLWTSFQFQGFIPSEAPFPAEFSGNLPVSSYNSFYKIVAEEHFRFLSHFPERPKLQRKSSMLAAYKQIPRDLLKKIKKLFYLDFALYGYDPEPQDIFNDV